MSETNPDENDDLEETYADNEEKFADTQYTVTLNGKEYALNRSAKKRIQERAKREFAGNEQFSCWWKTARPPGEKATDEEIENWEESVHSAGDPVLVIETSGRLVPWEDLDQLELEEQDASAFDSVADGGSGMRSVDPSDVDSTSDEEREKNRTHFGVTPQEFEELPSPDGEDPDRIPAKPEDFDEETMVMWVPDNPEVEHTWEAGEAITATTSWVEWNVQVKADQPRLDEDKADSHDHWESILSMDDCEQVGEVTDDSDDVQTTTSDEERDVPDRFDEGTAGGGHWNV